MNPAQYESAVRRQSPIRVVLFDAVGTLIFPVPPAAEVYHAMGQKHGSLFSLEQIAAKFSAAFRKHHIAGATDESTERKRWRNVVADVFEGSPIDELFEELWNHFARPDAWRLFDDVSVAWKQLQTRKLKIGIASNFDVRLEGLCKAISPLDQAAHVFYSSSVGSAKPHSQFFQYVQEALGIGPAEILLVGDDPINDYAGALAAGWQALLIDRCRTTESPHIGLLSELLSLLPD